MEVEFAAEEEDTDSVVVEIVEATSRGFQILNPTIESLRYGLLDPKRALEDGKQAAFT